MALASALASASAAVARCGSPRLASLASSPRSPSTRIASFSLASPRLARVASLASPHSPSHRLASVRLAPLTLASPCLARLTSSLLARPRLASPRSPSHRLARIASALAFLARRACSLASATAPFATGGLAASDMPPSKSSETQDTQLEEPTNQGFGPEGRLLPV